MAEAPGDEAPRSHVGEALRAGVPGFTDDGRFWDGSRLYVRHDERVRKGASTLLRSAAVVVEARMDCCPGEVVCGTQRIVAGTDLRVLREAGFVRFREAEGHVESWLSEDGTSLAMLVGQVTRPFEGRPA